MISATILGRLGSDPETKDVGKGTVTEFRVATTTKRGREEVTTWCRVSIWGARGEAFAKFHRKGSRCFVTGTLVNRSYEDKQGNQRYSLELDATGWAFAESKGEDKPAPQRSGGRSYGGGSQSSAPSEDIPFATCDLGADPHERMLSGDPPWARSPF